MNILVSGASGNIGYELIRGFKEIKTEHTIIAADFKPDYAKELLSEFDIKEFRKLDFTDQGTFNTALKNIDIVFLLRPPNLADVKKYFEPFVNKMNFIGIQKIVFLSVQGVESQKLIPHYKIEKLLSERNFEHIFLRPGYFMQNLTSTLLHEIKYEKKIFIPSGKLKFNWVDARDIGLVGAHLINDFNRFKNNAYEITGSEFVSFDVAAELLTDTLGEKVTYESPNLMKFFKKKRKLGIPRPMIFVMIMLHYLPRLGKNRERLTNTVKEITGNEPVLLKDFIKRNIKYFSDIKEK